jgi:DNA-binding HxlR family transcriptional regulator
MVPPKRKSPALTVGKLFSMEREVGTSPSRKSTCAETSSQVCPHFHGAVELIGKRWTGAILYTLSTGSQRFAELKAGVPGMSDRLLSTRLKELEKADLVDRQVHSSTPVKVTYELTDKGLSLTPIMESLSDWASEWHKA